jgi:L-aminopeptidase/D-esterase-like protein
MNKIAQYMIALGSVFLILACNMGSITNQKIEKDALKQFAKQVHTSMARAIQPFLTMYDGDTLYAITTSEVNNQNLDEISLGVIASEVVWDAVLSIADAKWLIIQAHDLPVGS